MNAEKDRYIVRLEGEVTDLRQENKVLGKNNEQLLNIINILTSQLSHAVVIRDRELDVPRERTYTFDFNMSGEMIIQPKLQCGRRHAI